MIELQTFKLRTFKLFHHRWQVHREGVNCCIRIRLDGYSGTHAEQRRQRRNTEADGRRSGS